jgi:hypothetical protein
MDLIDLGRICAELGRDRNALVVDRGASVIGVG